MARYGRDYDDVSRGMDRFYGRERHLFEGLFSRGDRDRDDLDGDDWNRGSWNRGDRDRIERGGWIGGGRYDREYNAGGMMGGSLNRGYGRDYMAGPGYTGGSSLDRPSFDPGYRGGMVRRRYGGDFDYGSDVSEMGGSLRHDPIGRDRDTGWNRPRDDFRAGGWNRGGDWDRDGDRDVGDRLREGWNDLRQGARRVFRDRTNRYDRNW